MDVMQFAGHVSNIVQIPERPSVAGPDLDSVRMWLPNGWGVILTGAPGEYMTATAARFTEAYAAGWETEPAWAPTAVPLKTGMRPGLPSRWEDCTPGGVASVLEQMAALEPVVPLAGTGENANNFACPVCGKLAVRDLSTLDYRHDRQSTECESCGEKIHRYPDGLGTARAWRIGA